MWQSAARWALAQPAVQQMASDIMDGGPTVTKHMLTAYNENSGFVIGTRRESSMNRTVRIGKTVTATIH